MVPRGEWSANVAYGKLNIVTNDGSSYLARIDVPAGTSLDNAVYWQLIAEKGDSGATGADGKSAYQIAVDNGFVGTESEWLASLKGDGITAGGVTFEMLSDDAIAQLITAIKTEIVPAGATRTTLSEWQFSTDGETYINCTVPHTVNAALVGTANFLVGKVTYRKSLELLKGIAYTLIFEGVGQRAIVKLDGVQIASHLTAYTPFAVALTATTGAHELTVECDNTVGVNYIPHAGDFNFCVGIDRPVTLIAAKSAHFLAGDYGDTRCYIAQNTTTAQSSITIKAASSKNSATCTVTVKDANGTTIATDAPITDADGSITAHILVDAPHLWAGLTDPYLYTLTLQLFEQGVQVDVITQRVGLRYFTIDRNDGFFLNGSYYPLRGVNYHTEGQGVASAMSAAQVDADFEVIKDIGCNFVRTAHYPSLHHFYDLCDAYGICCFTELPWVNDYYDATTAPTLNDNMCAAFAEIICDYRNHPSIVFWGISNEVLVSDAIAGIVLEQEKRLINLGHSLDARPIGITVDKLYGVRVSQTGADFIGRNQYPGWYSDGNVTDNGILLYLTDIRNSAASLIVGASEYGYGANPYQHTLTPAQDRTDGLIVSDGDFHPEEYQTLCHRKAHGGIYPSTQDNKHWILYTAIWVLFDFAVAARDEGCQAFTNDKGLISRDRSIKKDAYYFYKAIWNKAPMVHICGRRDAIRSAAGQVIEIFSNCDSVKIYSGETLITTLTTAADSTAFGVYWTTAMTLAEGDNVLRAVGVYTGGEVSDSVTLTLDSDGVTATGISIAATDSVQINSTKALNATITPAGANIRAGVYWQSGNPLVATVDGNGVVTGISTGTATIWAYLANGSRAACTLSVEEVQPEPTITRVASYTLGGTAGSAIPATISNDLDAAHNGLSLTGFGNYSSQGRIMATTASSAIDLTNISLPQNGIITISLANISGNLHALGRVFCIMDNAGRALQLFRNSAPDNYRCEYFNGTNTTYDLAPMSTAPTGGATLTITYSATECTVAVDFRDSDGNPLTEGVAWEISTNMFAGIASISILNKPTHDRALAASLVGFTIDSKG